MVTKSVSKEGIKAKQAKLLQKMKKKAKKILTTTEQTKDDVQIKNEENQPEQLCCAFCQEALDDYDKEPFGKFMLAQETPVLANTLK